MTELCTITATVTTRKPLHVSYTYHEGGAEVNRNRVLEIIDEERLNELEESLRLRFTVQATPIETVTIDPDRSKADLMRLADLQGVTVHEHGTKAEIRAELTPGPIPVVSPYAPSSIEVPIYQETVLDLERESVERTIETLEKRKNRSARAEKQLVEARAHLKTLPRVQ